jgi:hypothetical protein
MNVRAWPRNWDRLDLSQRPSSPTVGIVMRAVMTVANLAVARARIAESLGLTEDELLRQALESLLRQRKCEVMRQRLDILARYGVETMQDLEFKIAQGVVAEHPTWEDLIAVENLTARLEELDTQLDSLRSKGNHRSE